MFSARIKLLARSLGWHLSLWYAVGFVVSFGLVGAFAFWIIRDNDQRADRAEIREEFDHDAARCRQVGTDALLAETQAEQPDPEPTLLRVSSAVGPTLLLVPPFDVGKGGTRGIEAQLIRHRVQGWQRLDDPGTRSSWQVYAEPMPDGAWLQVAKSDRRNWESRARLRGALVPVTGFVVVASLLGAAVLTTRALRPVRRLIETTRRVIQSGDMTARVPTRAVVGNELDELNALFNQMLARNESLIRGMHEALDNVAHDLRTPLTRLRSSAEAALRGPSADAGLRGEALADALEESERTLAILRVLIDISEAEHGAMRLGLEPLRLEELVGVAVELYAHVAEEHGVRCEVSISNELLVRGDRVRLQQVIANLLENAIKYSRPDTTVRIEAGWDDDLRQRVWLWVRDEGIGIAAHDLPRIWDRLYRADRSRSTRGSGLGLSLVKAIVQAHGGTVEVVSEPNKGSTFTLLLPTAEERETKAT